MKSWALLSSNLQSGLPTAEYWKYQVWENISCEVRRMRWNWIGHILRREGNEDCKIALGWQPEEKRARGRPKTTWRRTVEKK